MGKQRWLLAGTCLLLMVAAASATHVCPTGAAASKFISGFVFPASDGTTPLAGPASIVAKDLTNGKTATHSTIQYNATNNLYFFLFDAGLQWNAWCDGDQATVTINITVSGQNYTATTSKTLTNESETTEQFPNSTLQLPTDTTPPTAGSPSYSAANTTSSSFSVTWSAGNDSQSGIKNYDVARATANYSGGACSSFGSYSTVATVTSTSHSDTGLASDGCYRWLIVTRNNADLTSNSSDGATVRRDATAPTSASPTYAEANITGSSYTVTWTAGSDGGSGLRNYDVERASATYSGGTCGTFGSYSTVATVSAETTSYSDTGLTGDGCYRWRIVARDWHGNTAPSSDGAIVRQTSPPSTSPPAGGGPGPGGGGPGPGGGAPQSTSTPAAPPPAPVLVEDRQEIPATNVGETAKVTLTNTPVQEIAVQAARSIQAPVRVTASQFSSRPSTVSGEPSGKAYAYLSIEAPGLDPRDVAKITLKTRVEQSWVKENGFTPDHLRLQRYTDVWTPLPTQKESEDAQFIYLRAESPGLSFFAVTGEKPGPTAPGLAPAQPSPTPQSVYLPPVGGEPPARTPGLEGAFAALALLTGLALLRKRR